MPSDYEQITRDNIAEYGKGKRHLAYLGDLYPDKTHFIFELLQNAEDAKASKVRFVVSQDKLEMMHDGRTFTTQDVKGVCGIGESQKADDLTKIGRFGIGFKSVYAYTNSPEIHSGDEHFRIYAYVRPCPARRRNVCAPWTTLFVFPFDKHSSDQVRPCREISECLSRLNTRTLLFLRRIVEIEFMSSETSCIFLRSVSKHGAARKIELIEKKGEEEKKEKWIVFERPVRNGADHAGFVEIGFRSNGEVKAIEPIPKRDTLLVVYFPTEVRTDLGFCIQGPYRTTLARDNVPPDDSWNKKLVTETAELTVDALRQLKTMGLLTIPVLETLPINADDFLEGRFNPIFTRVKEALLNEALLPADDGSFVAGRHAMLARGAELTKLLDYGQLRSLFGDDDVRWLSSNVTQDRTHELRRYLTKELEVVEVTPDVFADHITKDFLTDQSDAWVKDFYCWLAGHRALWLPEGAYTRRPEGVLRNEAIVRVQDGSHVVPFRDDGEPAAYLPSKDDAETHVTERGPSKRDGPPIVRAVLTRHDETLKFLKDLGLREFDVVEEILRHVLPKYKSESDIPHNDNRIDLAKIGHAYDTVSSAKRSRLEEELSKTPFILCSVPATGKQEYRTADEVYFRSDELVAYFEGDESFGYIEPDHGKSTLFRKLGASDGVRIKKKDPGTNGHVTICRRTGSHSRGRAGFDPGAVVDGLENALADPNADKSAFIWSKIAIPYLQYIRGVVESSEVQTFEADRTDRETKLSAFGALLAGKEWLPDANGDMHKPSDLSVDDLHKSLDRSSAEIRELVVQLGMKRELDAELLESAGVPPSTLTRLQRLENAPPETQRQIDDLLEPPDFPTGGTVEDPERRQSRVRREHEGAPTKEYEQRARNVRTTRNTIDPDTQLRQWYTNESGQMVCQICKNEMPFKRRDGKYYFEKREALSRDYLRKEYASQFLALCPVCAAKYKHFVKDAPEGEAMEELRRALVDTDSTEPDGLKVPLKFGEESTTVRFVPRHVIDLKAILGE